MRNLLLLPAAFFLLMFLTGCSSEEPKAQQEQVLSDVLELKNFWVRAGSQNRNSAGYGEIVNGTGTTDTLLSVNAKGIGRSEVHESYTTEDGLSGMRPAEKLVIPPGEILKLEPGGFHLMLMSLERDLQPGDSLMLTLQFAQAGTITRQAMVREK